MTAFIIASVVLAAVTLAILTRPYWRRSEGEPDAALADRVQPLREQIRQLDAELAAGSLSQKAHAAARAKLEREIVDSVVAAPVAQPASAGGRPLGTLAGFAVFCAAIAIGGYAWLGDPGALDPASRPQAQAKGGGEEGAHEVGMDQIAAMAEKLAARLEKQPDDPVGWAMLARSYAVTGQHEKSVPIFRKALTLNKDDANLLADFADTLAVTQQRTITGEPLTLVMQALKIEPNNMKALSLAGSEAFARKDYKGALVYWEKLKTVAPADSAFGQQLDGGIAEARSLAGLPPLQPSPVAAVTAPTVVAAAPAASSDAAPAGGVATSGKSVSGVVTLSAALAGNASPTDTVFVFARAANGPRMPLAILRHQVKDLPLRFTLDDSLAMSPASKISAFPQVIVGARISKSGQAMPQAGDLEGLSAAVDVGSADVKVEINQTVGR